MNRKLSLNSPLLLSLALIIITGLIAIYKIKIMLIMGPAWDSMDFLIESLELAGQGVGYADLTRPPLIPFLVSLFIKMGINFKLSLYAVTGLLYVFAVLGLYLFLQLRFDPFKSFFGCILFATFPFVLDLVADGISDIPSVAFSIWALYFLVLAVKTNSKYFYLVFPLIMLSFLSRFPAALIIFPVILYILINKERIKYKNMVIGLLLSLIPLIPVLFFFYGTFGDPFYPFVYFLNQSSGYFITDHIFANLDHLFYLKNLDAFGGASLGLLLIILAGLTVYLIKIIKNRTKNQYNEFKDWLRNKKMLLIVFLFIIFILIFGEVSYLVSEMVFLVWAYILYLLFKDREIRFLDLNLLVFAWFMVFFIFHSIHVIKVERYYVTMAPAVAYFLVWGLENISNNFGLKFKKDINLSYYVLSVLLIIIVLLSTASYFNHPSNQPTDERYAVQLFETSSNWLKGYDSSYQDKVIYADGYWPYFSFYLKTNVRPMPVFKNNNAYFYELKGYIIGSEENNKYNEELQKNNVSYYFSIRNGLNLIDYNAIYRINFITLYERKRS